MVQTGGTAKEEQVLLRIRFGEYMLTYYSIILNVIAPILNGFIAWLVGYHKGSFAGWRIIFLVLGAFTFLWAFVVFFFLQVVS